MTFLRHASMAAVVLSILQGFFVVVSSRCTGYNSPTSVTRESGFITSPLYPNSYSDNEKCTWVLNSPFSHNNYLLFYDVIDIHVSHKRLDGQMKCTGHLKLYDVETDCKSTTPFCKVYYKSDDCVAVARENYPDCVAVNGDFVPGNVRFTSEHYFPAFTPQRGFKLQYNFVDCTPATTTTTTAAATTTTTTTAATTTTETTIPETTTDEIITERDTTTTVLSTEAITSSAFTTSPVVTTSPITHPNGTEGAVISTSLPTWVYAVIAVGIVIVIIVVIAVVVVRRRRQKSEDINWLMGIENPHYSDLLEKNKLNVTAVARRENNYA